MPNHPTPSFICSHCGNQVAVTSHMGTHNRNHCPSCLWSQHLDEKVSGDRKSHCRQEMQPVSLTFKHEGQDKYGKEKQGELMLVHKCVGCGKISINRLAADDNPDQVLEVFTNSQLKPDLQALGINLLTSSDLPEVKTQLFGKNY